MGTENIRSYSRPMRVSAFDVQCFATMHSVLRDAGCLDLADDFERASKQFDMPTRDWDRLKAIYRAWLVFDELPQGGAS